MCPVSRDYIASFEDGTLAARFQSSEEKNLNANISLSRAQGVLDLVADADTHTVQMNVGGEDAGSMSFSSGLRIVSDGSEY